MGRWRHVDPTSDRPVFKQIADALRSDIGSGQLPQGGWLPSEADLGSEFGAGRNSVRKALRTLSSEGLVTSVAGKGTQVRDPIERDAVKIGPGARITSRMPTDAERQTLSIPEGTPLLIVERDGHSEVLPADRFAIMTVESDETEDH